MRHRKNTYYHTGNLLKGGRSFAFRGIFSRFSNAKKSPVLGNGTILDALAKPALQAMFHGLAKGNSPQFRYLILREHARIRSLALRSGPLAVCPSFPPLKNHQTRSINTGKGLVLLKTGFAKKPKNPV